jgi:hypothetical protein
VEAELRELLSQDVNMDSGEINQDNDNIEMKID